jgi:hypothetical protein
MPSGAQAWSVYTHGKWDVAKVTAREVDAASAALEVEVERAAAEAARVADAAAQGKRMVPPFPSYRAPPWRLSCLLVPFLPPSYPFAAAAFP